MVLNMGKRKIIIGLIFIFSLIQCADESNLIKEQEGWAKLDEILEKIQPPQFPDLEINVVDHGAIADDNKDDRQAFIAAINECHEKGGGIVIVPEGDYISNGPIVLKSNVNFHTEENVIIKFSTDPADYLPVVFTRWEGVELYNYSPLIYAYEEENIAITGKGTFDGQASNDNWWSWKGRPEFDWEEGMPNQSFPDSRPRLMQMNLDDVPVEERIFGEGTYLRPNFIQPYKCKNVLIEGVTFLDSPMWFIHPVLCENVTVENVKTIGLGPNNDGCNPESSKYVLIKGCYFNNGDDCIAIKSGRNNDGRRIGVASEYIVVQDCEMKEGHGGVVMGSEISGDCRYVFAENCVMDSPNLDRAIRLKSNSIRGGTIEHVYARNITIGSVGEAILKLNMNYDPKDVGPRNYPPVMQHIYLENVTSDSSKYALYLEGLETSKVNNIFLKDCEFSGVEEGNFLKHVESLETDNVYINGEEL